jgi:hypothetical protein
VFFKTIWLNKKQIGLIFTPKRLKRKDMAEKLKSRQHLLTFAVLQKPRSDVGFDFKEDFHLDEKGIFKIEPDENLGYLLKMEGKGSQEKEQIREPSKSERAISKLKTMFGKIEKGSFSAGTTSFGSGRGCQIQLPASVFDFEQLNYKIFYSYYNGFHIKDYGKNNRTCFKVGERPYFLDLDMVIQVGKDVRLQVVHLDPLPRKPAETKKGILIETHSRALMSQEFGLKQVSRSLNHYLDYKEQFNAKRTKNLYKDITTKPEILLRVVAGGRDLIGKEYHIKISTQAEKNLFIFGKHFKHSDFMIRDPTVSNKHFVLDYSGDYGWLIQEWKEERVVSHFGTFVYLANAAQLKQRLPSFAHPVYKNQVICTGQYQFKVETTEKDRSNQVMF